jgi:hypothetical protein
MDSNTLISLAVNDSLFVTPNSSSSGVESFASTYWWMEGRHFFPIGWTASQLETRLSVYL